jgi:thiol:disulfide interchange protein DsbG
MQASDPAQAMNEHEQSLLAGQGGMSASANVPAELEAAIKSNSQLLDSLGADAVPFIVAKNARNGQVVSKAGAMATPALAELLGVSAP